MWDGMADGLELGGDPELMINMKLIDITPFLQR
jgi:hypothetical protein